MNISEIKTEARKRIEGNIWTTLMPFLLVMFVMFLFRLLVGFFFKGIDVPLEFSDGSFTKAGYIVDLAISFVSTILSVGVINYILRFVRGKEVGPDCVFEIIKEKWLLIVVTTILVSIFTFLWSLLLIIPGIIAAISYTMVYYIIIDNKDMTSLEVIKKSKEMMNGYKWNYLGFCLSFLGWIILGIFTLGILYIWLIPYMNVSIALYYEKLKEITSK